MISYEQKHGPYILFYWVLVLLRRDLVRRGAALGNLGSRFDGSHLSFDGFQAKPASHRLKSRGQRRA